MKILALFLLLGCLPSCFGQTDTNLIGTRDGEASLPFGSGMYDFSRVLPNLKHTKLDLRITGGAQGVRAVAEPRALGQQTILSFPVRIENRSDRTITAYIANEWYGGEWPPTDLYAAVKKSGDKTASWISHEVYVAGETGRVEGYVWKPGEVRELSLRLNWPGTGSQHGGMLLSENTPGKYSLKVFLIFRAPETYSFEYAQSAEMEIQIDQTKK